MKEYYEIRLESIGGLGANLCGKMLGELGLRYLGLNSSSFASYGSEKTGTPVKGFIRYCKADKEIRVHYPVVHPDLLVVFHEALLTQEGIWKGCNRETNLIVACDLSEGNPKWAALDAVIGGIKKLKKCFVVDAQKIAMESKSRINVVMLGAILKVMGVEDLSIGEKICRDTLGKKYPDALANNIEGMKRGYSEVSVYHVLPEGRNTESDTKCDCGETCKERQGCFCEEEWGYENAPLGGINPKFGSSVLTDLSASRQGYVPIFLKERCINCGLCHSTCPDMVFQFVKGEYKGKEMMINQGLDYYHCKGCLRCVDICPVNALVMGLESENPDKEYFLPNRELKYMPKHYDKAGPDGYITSESYLTEERMEGGEV